MKIFKHKILIIFIVLSWVILCGLECHWDADDDDNGNDNSNDPAETETLETRTYATVDTIDVTMMDVETDDGVILTCDLPTGVVLVVGDRVEITITFESNESMWVITTTEFFQKI